MSDYVRYSMDASQSQFTVHAFASGLAAVVAHNPKFAIRGFSGEARFISDNRAATLTSATKGLMADDGLHVGMTLMLRLIVFLRMRMSLRTMMKR